jgi:hypothetical protein
LPQSSGDPSPRGVCGPAFPGADERPDIGIVGLALHGEMRMIRHEAMRGQLEALFGSRSPELLMH